MQKGGCLPPCNTLAHYKPVVTVLLAHVACGVVVGGFSNTLEKFRRVGVRLFRFNRSLKS